MKSHYTAEGEVYQVSKERAVDSKWQDDPDWYEYRVRLLRAADGACVTEWDSFDECYNGQQKLDREEAEKAVQTIVQDVKDGKESDWFNLPS
jgi:hypothetical protein